MIEARALSKYPTLTIGSIKVNIQYEIILGYWMQDW